MKDVPYLLKQKRHPVSEVPFRHHQNSRVNAAIHEARLCKLHLKAKRNEVPFGWLASIARKTVIRFLLYLARAS